MLLTGVTISHSQVKMNLNLKPTGYHFNSSRNRNAQDCAPWGSQCIRIQGHFGSCQVWVIFQRASSTGLSMWVWILKNRHMLLVQTALQKPLRASWYGVEAPQWALWPVVRSCWHSLVFPMYKRNTGKSRVGTCRELEGHGCQKQVSAQNSVQKNKELGGGLCNPSQMW